MTTPTPERWQRIESLLHRALETESARRAALLQRECGDDPALRAEVESLIAASGEGGILHTGVALRGEEPATEPQPLPAQARLGAWRIGALIGRGGMGEVYRAERADGEFQQQVAIKLLRREAGEHLARFHAERRILARLEHPGIARLIDSVVTDDGRPAMVMEYVDGVPLLDWCRQRQADLATRLGLFTQVCEAVGFAHANLVIHRDLKPSNILVGADGRVKLLDFGVAKLLDPGAWNEDTHTRTRLAPMTPAHAAPEQLRGEAITTATDVYALGIVLFELLAGRPPWQLHELPMSVALHKLLSEEALRASDVADREAQAPIPARVLRGDLDAIAARALRKDPRERYPTVASLRADLDRYLAGEPVSARRGGEWYRFGKLLRRNRLAVSLTTLALLVGAGFVWRLVLAEHRAAQEAQAAQAVTEYLVSLFDAASPDATGGQPISPEALLDAGRQRLETTLASQPRLQTRMLGTLGQLYRTIGNSTEALRLLHRAVKQHAALSEPDPQLGSALWYQLGLAQEAQEQMGAAQRSYQTALDLHAAAQPSEDAQSVRIQAGLGRMQDRNGDPEAGVRQLQAALASAHRLGEPAIEIGVLSDLSNAYSTNGQAKAAGDAIDAALQLQAAQTGEDDLRYLRLLEVKTAQLYFAQDYRAAEPLARRVLAGFTRFLGADATATTDASYRLAAALSLQGKMREAIPLFAQTAEVEARVTSGDTPSVAQTLFYWGYDLTEIGDLAAAIPLLERAARIWRQSGEGDDRVAHMNRLILGRAQAMAGHDDAALSTLAADIPARFSAQIDLRERVRRQQILGDLALGRGRLDEAASHYQQARQRVPPGSDVDRDLSHGEARLLLARGEACPAAMALRRQAETLSGTDAPEAPWLLRIRLDAADAVDRCGDRAAATAMLAALREPLAKGLAEDAPEQQRFGALWQRSLKRP